MRKISVSLRALALAAALAACGAQPGAATSQDGPPPEVREAIDSVVRMLNTEGDATLDEFIENRMKETPTPELRERLSALRAAAAGKRDDVSVEAQSDGLLLILGGRGGEAHIKLVLDGAAVSDIALAETDSGGGGGDRDARAQDHLRALEDLSRADLDAALAEFEAERFSEAYLARTTRDQRRDVLGEVKDAAAAAGGVMADERNGEVILGLRGPNLNADVVFTLQSSPPFAIDSLRVDEGSAAAPAIELTRDNIADTFDTLAAEEGLTGVVSVTLSGDEILKQGYGIANEAVGSAITPDTVFGIGSMPIDFTIDAVSPLAQRGEIDFDDSIAEYFDGVPDDKRAMTIRHLLKGESGLPDFFDTVDDWDADLAWIDREEAERRLLAQELRFPPGEGRGHSHGGYVLLAALVERVTGQEYYAFIRENFLDPAGITRTGLYGERRDLSIGDFAEGGGPSRIGAPNIPPNWGPTSWLIMGSGGMYSTLNDMLAYYDYVRTSGVLQDEYLRRYESGLGVGGSERGYFIAHAYGSGGSEAIIMINFDGRQQLGRDLTDALRRLIEQEG